MGITLNQELPSRPEEKSSWTSRPLFPLKVLSNLVVKSVVNIYDAALVLVVVVGSIRELFYNGMSLEFFAVIIVLLLASIKERKDCRDNIPKEDKK